MATLLHYKNSKGEDIVVDDLKAVPEQYRNQVKVLSDNPGAVTPKEVARVVEAAAPKIDWPSFGFGAAAGGVTALFLTLLLRGRPRLLRFAMVVVVICGAAVGYLTFLSKQAGIGSKDGGIATPASIIEDARGAAKALEEKQKQQQEALEQLK